MGKNTFSTPGGGSGTSDLEGAFRRALKDMAEKCAEAAEDILKEFLSELVDNSPVRTGEYLANWQVSDAQLTAPDHKEPNKSSGFVKSREGMRIRSIARRIASGEGAFRAQFVNTARHAYYVEFGSSRNHMPPRLVAHRAVAKLQEIVAKYAPR